MDELGPFQTATAQTSGGQRKSTRVKKVPVTFYERSVNGNPPNTSAQNTPAVSSSRSTPGSSRSTPMDVNQEEEDASPTKRTGLRRKREESDEPRVDPLEAALEPLTNAERQEWPGWVELESEPALFNYTLGKYGVNHVKVKEVLGLEDEYLGLLPQPVFGLIFLFRYWQEQEEEAEELPKCPDNVWFANQLTVTNACATIALLNIVMNIPDIDLGEELATFKAETSRLKPAYRGQELGNNTFIRNIHNTFATRMDMLNADLALSNEVDKWRKAKNAKKRKGSARKTQAKSKKKDEEEPGFHFIAYVPIEGNVWRLDGMQRQPANLGEMGNDWTSVARENINIHIAQHDDGLQFSLMSLCRCPLLSIPESLASNLHSISAVESALGAALPDWQQFIEVDTDSPPLPNQPNDTFAISQELLTQSNIPDTMQRKLRAAVGDPTELLQIRRELLAEQRRLQNLYVQEAASIEEEKEQAARRKIDYTPVIYESIKELADAGVLKEIVRDLTANGRMKPS